MMAMTSPVRGLETLGDASGALKPSHRFGRFYIWLSPAKELMVCEEREGREGAGSFLPGDGRRSRQLPIALIFPRVHFDDWPSTSDLSAIGNNGQVM